MFAIPLQLFIIFMQYINKKLLVAAPTVYETFRCMKENKWRKVHSTISH